MSERRGKQREAGYYVGEIPEEEEEDVAKQQTSKMVAGGESAPRKHGQDNVLPTSLESRPSQLVLPRATAYNDPGHDRATVHEQEILAEIQELQHRLWKLQSGVDSPSADASKQGNGADGNSKKPQQQERLIVVSNRLPLSVVRNAQTNQLEFKMSSGGLVSAMRGLNGAIADSFVWVGWLGTEIEKEEQDSVRTKLRAEYANNLKPVFLTEKVAKGYYDGFSNDVLWPLFHYQPLPSFKPGHERKFEMDMWTAYLKANQQFVDAIVEIYKPGDLVWVHDYHLMMLPLLLRRQIPDVRVGWFLHIPFPSSEVYRQLPVRKEILEGVLSADLVGFHTYDYARHFLSSCTRVLGLECSPKGVEFDGHFCSLGVFPIGIDVKFFLETLGKPKTVARIKELCATFSGLKVMLGVDRLDYIKGMPHKFLALERLLKRHPEWVKKLVMVQIAVPSRTNVDEYKLLCTQVNELVGRINGRYGTLDYMPIHYINRSVTPEELCALYNVADVAVVTSVRDGMNLVSHEYVVCQQDKIVCGNPPGVLVLSEFTGSAQSLSGAVRVNPWNTEELADSFHEALMMGEVERELRQSKLYRYVTTHTAHFWAQSFVNELIHVSLANRSAEKLYDQIKQSGPPLPTSSGSASFLPIRQVLEAYRSTKHRIIITSLEGVLAPHESAPNLTVIPNSVRANLNTLAKDPKNTVVVVSAWTKKTMQDMFGKLRCIIAAEHGFHYRLGRSEEWRSLEDLCSDNSQKQSLYQDEWKQAVLPIMNYFLERTPGSNIETRQFSLTWNYRGADQDFGAWQAKDLHVHLEDITSELPLEVYQGKRLVEVRHVLANKGRLVERLFRHLNEQGKQVDFVFCAGSDRSDDDMFATFNAALQTVLQSAAIQNGQTSNPPSGTNRPRAMSAGTSSTNAESTSSKQSNGSLGASIPLSTNAAIFCCRVGRDRRSGQSTYTLGNISHMKEMLAILADCTARKSSSLGLPNTSITPHQGPSPTPTSTNNHTLTETKKSSSSIASNTSSNRSSLSDEKNP